MSDAFFERPILTSPYEVPSRHWELDASGQPTQEVKESRRRADFITPIPKPKKRKAAEQQQIVFADPKGLSTESQQYDLTGRINQIRGYLAEWRKLPAAPPLTHFPPKCFPTP